MVQDSTQSPQINLNDSELNTETLTFPESGSQQEEPLQPSNRSYMKRMLLIAVLIGGSILAFVSFMYYKNMYANENAKETVSTDQKETEEITWQEYRSPVSYFTMGSPEYFTIRYPEGWEVTEIHEPEEGLRALITNGDYQIHMQFKDFDFGPGTCIFPDDPRFNQSIEELGPMLFSMKCDQEYVEYEVNSVQARRKVEPNTSTESSWTIYLKNEQEEIGFSTVPPISFIAPLQYDPDVITTMDQILSTLQLHTENTQTNNGNFYTEFPEDNVAVNLLEGWSYKRNVRTIEDRNNPGSQIECSEYVLNDEDNFIELIVTPFCGFGDTDIPRSLLEQDEVLFPIDEQVSLMRSVVGPPIEVAYQYGVVMKTDYGQLVNESFHIDETGMSTSGLNVSARLRYSGPESEQEKFLQQADQIISSLRILE